MFPSTHCSLGTPRRQFMTGVGALSLVASAAAPWQLAFAQLRVEVSGIGATQLPLAIAPFKSEELAPHKASAVISADLVRSGVFKFIDMPLAGLDEMSRPDFTKWRSAGVESVVTGSCIRLADGRMDVRFRLWDTVKGVDLGGQSLPVAAADLRYALHKISDWIYEKLTGDKGVFATRIAYITKNGIRYNLWVADADGEAALSALQSQEPIISPVWSPSGQQLAYVSFESRKAVVYVHEISTGRRRVVANFKGSNSAPAWSPDGQYLAMTLSQGGGSQIYWVPASGAGDPKALSRSNSIDTEAVVSPDGNVLYFVSDRGGNPQIYRMAVRPNQAGDKAERVTFGSNSNISPAISPDGKKMAFISRVAGAFKLVLMHLDGGAVQALTDTTADESPSFSPNGKQIIYATQVLANGRWQEALMMTTLDGKNKAKLTSAAGDIREPDWGPWAR